MCRAVLFFMLFGLVHAVAQVEIITLDNKARKGEIIEIVQGKKSEVLLKTARGAEKIDWQEIVEILFPNATSEHPGSVCLILNDGARVYGNITDGNQQFIFMQSVSLGTLSIELTRIREIRFNTRLTPLEYSEIENDVLYFKSGDLMKCLIENFGKGYVQVQHPQLGTRKEYFEKLERITFAQLEKGAPKLDVFCVTVVGVDNSRITGSVIGFSRNTMTLQCAGIDSQVNIALGNISHLSFQGGRFVYISDFPESRYRISYTPFFQGTVDPFLPKFDLNQRGGPIRLGSHHFYKGIGVCPKTEITIALNGEFKRFQSHIGVDGIIGENLQQRSHLIGGSVVFQVWCDGKKEFDSGILKWSSPPFMLEIDVRGKKELVLTTDFGENADVNDLANWAGARLLK